MLKPQISKRQQLIDDFFSVEKLTILDKNDKSYSRLVVVPKPAVGILLFNPVKEVVILSTQFRPAIDNTVPDYRNFLEIPAGVVDLEEDPEKAAVREALEETGYTLAAIQYISRIYTSPGYTSEYIDLYFGEISSEDRIHLGGGLDDENEDIIVCEINLNDAINRVNDGKISDAKTIVAIRWLEDRLRKLKNSVDPGVD